MKYNIFLSSLALGSLLVLSTASPSEAQNPNKACNNLAKQLSKRQSRGQYVSPNQLAQYRDYCTSRDNTAYYPRNRYYPQSTYNRYPQNYGSQYNGYPQNYASQYNGYPQSYARPGVTLQTPLGRGNFPF